MIETILLISIWLVFFALLYFYWDIRTNYTREAYDAGKVKTLTLETDKAVKHYKEGKVKTLNEKELNNLMKILKGEVDALPKQCQELKTLLNNTVVYFFKSGVTRDTEGANKTKFL